MLTKEELLKPRIKVEKPWPFMLLMVGDILMPDKEGYYNVGGDNWYDIKFFEAFPHLFKILEWWEERKPEEMPKYFKTPTASILKATSQHVGENKQMFEYYNGHGWVRYSLCEPVTEEEYNSFRETQYDKEG